MNNGKKIKVAVIFGGRSGEHEVSLVSASSVMENLDKAKYEVIPIGITKQGKWIAGPDSMKLLKSGSAPAESNAIMKPEPGSETIDVVFPVLHGPFGEDGTVQGLLELMGVPYVGCGVLADALCMDKVMQKNVLAAEGFTQTKYTWFWKREWEQNTDSILKKCEDELGYPMFVKPANLGSSVGISKAGEKDALKTAILEAALYDRKIIVEAAVSSAREIECAVLGNQEPRASIAGEIIPSGEFYDYDAKYVDGKSEARIPAPISPEEMELVQKLAVKAFRALDCEGLARVDFLRAGDGTYYLNELNTLPGFTSISMYPKLWEASGLPYAKLLDELINLAIARSQEKSNLRSSYEPKKAWHTS